MVVFEMLYFIIETVEHNKFLKHFKNFNITAIEQDIDEFVDIDNERSHEGELKESNILFEEQRLVNEDGNITSDENEAMDFDTISRMLQASKTIDNFYAKIVVLSRN